MSTVTVDLTNMMKLLHTTNSSMDISSVHQHHYSIDKHHSKKVKLVRVIVYSRDDFSNMTVISGCMYTMHV